MLTLGTVAALFHYMGDGPLYPEDGIEPLCSKSWWVNLLYINNIKQDNMVYILVLSNNIL